MAAEDYWVDENENYYVDENENYYVDDGNATCCCTQIDPCGDCDEGNTYTVTVTVPGQGWSPGDRECTGGGFADCTTGHVEVFTDVTECDLSFWANLFEITEDPSASPRCGTYGYVQINCAVIDSVSYMHMEVGVADTGYTGYSGTSVLWTENFLLSNFTTGTYILDETINFVNCAQAPADCFCEGSSAVGAAQITIS